MKTPFVIALVLAAGLQLSTTASAQPQPGRGRASGRPVREAWAKLTPDERTKLRGAHRSAVADPSVQAARERMQAARKQYHDSMRAALLKADPSVQPILEKLPTPPEKNP